MATIEPHQPPPPDGGPKGERRGNASPPPARSKRDKKLQLLGERLAFLSEKFNRDRDVSYREQLQQIQIDTSLVMRVDPHEDKPLDFIAPTRVERDQVLEVDRAPSTGSRSLLEMAGPSFHQWHADIEDLLEARDYELTKQKFEYEVKLKEHTNVHQYKVETANREYKAQKGTIRDRLLNTISSRRVRLTKDKEITDITDHPAALLHPNQFSLNNPASPGGIQNKRATRLRQTADDGSGFDNRKRKRNAADEDGSPAPQRRAVDLNGTTPLWQGERLATRQVPGPVYSIDKLFTDKELTMQHNASALAAHKYLLTHPGKTNGTGQGTMSSSGSESGDHEDGDQDGTESVPSAVMMERVPSHATRSTRAGAQNQNFVDDKLVGFEGLTNFEMPANLEKMIAAEPKFPPVFSNTYAKPPAKGENNVPAGLLPDDINSDLMVMKLLKQYETIHGTGSNFDTPNGGRKVLETAAEAVLGKDSRFVAFLHHDRRDPDELRKDLRLPASTVRDEPVTPSGSATAAIAPPPSGAGAVGASPMSRQSSQGGAAMSRQGSNTRAQRKRNQ